MIFKIFDNFLHINTLYNMIFFRKRQGKIAHNVKGLRRFCCPNKGFAKQRPGQQKCGWSEPWEGA
ncbi:hypothetical protein FACS1894142_5420 [Spirochaetia bacterium]|nr:hypothetical protein FACS1894142_5420 [Spirochaetia bacterium]